MEAGEKSDLLVLAEKLRTDVDSLRNAQTTGRQIEELQGYQQQVFSSTEELRRFVGFLEAVRQDKPVDVPAQRLKPIVDAASALANEREIERLPDAARRLQQQLVAAREVLHDRAAEVWREFRGATRVMEQRSLFEALAVIPAFKERCRDLIERSGSLEAQLASPTPPGESGYRIIKRVLAEFEEQVSTLQVGEFPALVSFLQRSVRGEATVADLMSDRRLLQWIIEQGLEDHFFVRPGRPVVKRS